MKVIGEEKVKRLDEFLRSYIPDRSPATHKHTSKEAFNTNEPLLDWTGHPFVDAGLVAILLIANKNKPEELTKEDIGKAIDFAAALYAKDEWVKYLTRIFRNNNPILMINPSMRKNMTKEKLQASLKKLFELIPSSEEEGAKCQICGRRRKIDGLELRKAIHSKDKAKPKEISGDVFPLLGTGEVRNFFPAANPLGADICAHCLFLVQLMPLASYAIRNDKRTVMGSLVFHAHPPDKIIRLSEEAVNSARISSIVNNARGFKKPENFLFNRIIEITRKIERGSRYWQNATVTLYYFLNGNRSGEQWIDIKHIPNSVLKFVAVAGERYLDEWKNIINMGWMIKKRNKEKKSFEELEKNYSNEIYRRLLNGESILHFFYNPTEKKVNASWELLEFYCQEVLGLDEKTLEFIKEIGDRIVETLETLEDNQLRRTIRELENSTRLYQFENFFIRVEKIRQQKGLPNALLTFDEFAKLLTGYGEDINTSWRVVRDLLLFRMYEKLHNRLIKSKGEESVDIKSEKFEEMPYVEEV